MSNVWYYASGGTPQGPLNLADLLSIISRAGRPSDVLIWSPGFEGWERAADVREIAERLFNPPPVDDPKPASNALPPAPIPVQESQSHSLEDVKWVGTTDPKLKGIAGWLILFAIGQVAGPLTFLGSALKYYGELDGALWQQFPATFIGEAVITAALFVLYFATAYAFFKTRILACLSGKLSRPL
jgi:hypothetical protein